MHHLSRDAEPSIPAAASLHLKTTPISKPAVSRQPPFWPAAPAHVLIVRCAGSSAKAHKAQALADEVETQLLQQKLHSYVNTYCPAGETLEILYYWTLAQVEYSSDLVFRKQSNRCHLRCTGSHRRTCGQRSKHRFRMKMSPQRRLASCRSPKTAALGVTKEDSLIFESGEADDIATFLGKQLRSSNSEQIGNNFHVRIQGSRIKHSMGPVSMKYEIYDKAGLILRIETTTNDPS